MNITFQVVSSAIVDKYIGESARLIREMFNYARDHQPCIIFMDEIDAIGGRRFSEGTSADREIQRTLMELLNQMDGFDSLGQVKFAFFPTLLVLDFISVFIPKPIVNFDLKYLKHSTCSSSLPFNAIFLPLPSTLLCICSLLNSYSPTHFLQILPLTDTVSPPNLQLPLYLK